MRKMFRGPEYGALTRYDVFGAHPTTGVTFNETGSFLSANTANFKLIKNRRDLPWHDHYFAKYNNIYEVGSYGYVQDWPGGFFQGSKGAAYGDIPVNVINPYISPDPGLVQQLNGKVLDQLKNQSVNLAQAFAERKQTVNMLAKTVNRLASAAIAIKHGKLIHASKLFGGTAVSKKYRRRNGFEYQYVNHPAIGTHIVYDTLPSPKNLSNFWLEYVYGWRPLLSDIHGSCELLAKTFSEKRPSRLSVGLSTKKVAHDYQTKVETNGYNSNEFTSSSVTQSARYVIEFSEDNSFLTAMAQTGISNPINLAWELVPHSFVIDWLIPVGSYLNRLDATNGLAFLRGTLSVKESGTHASRWINVKPESKYWQVQGCGRTFSYQEKRRTVLTSFPSIPDLRINPHLGVSRVLSGIALLTQAFSGRK